MNPKNLVIALFTTLMFAIGFGTAVLLKPKKPQTTIPEPTTSTRTTPRPLPSKKLPLTKTEITRLATSLKNPNDPDSISAHGQLLAGMTAENADLIGQTLNASPSYYFRLGELKKQNILELKDQLDQRHFHEALAGWVHADHDAAMTWYHSQSEKHQKSLAKAITKGLASFDLQAAEKFALTWLGRDPFVPGRLMNLVYAKKALILDLPELGKWADQVTNKGALDWKMLTKVANRATQNDPVMAIEWAATLPQNRDWVNDRIASSWSDTNPKACGEWLLTRPAGKERDRSLSHAFHDWVNHDIEAGKAFLSKMEPSHDKDLALSGFSSGLTATDPVSSIKLAQQIRNPETRQQKIFEIAQNYWRWHPKKAEAWLPKSGLTPDQIKKIKDQLR